MLPQFAFRILNVKHYNAREGRVRGCIYQHHLDHEILCLGEIEYRGGMLRMFSL